MRHIGFTQSGTRLLQNINTGSDQNVTGWQYMIFKMW